MPSPLRDRLRSHKLDKWFGLGRVGGQAAVRVLLSILIARFAGRDAFAVYVALQALEIVANTVVNAGWVTPLGSLAPALPAAERPAFVRWALARAARAAGITGGVLLGGTPVAAIVFAVDPFVWLGFCVSTVVWLIATARAGALVATFRASHVLLGLAVGYLVPVVAVFLAYQSAWPVHAVFWWANAVGLGWACVVMGRELRGGAGDAGGGGPTPELCERFRAFGRVAIVGSVANSVCTRVQPFVLFGVSGSAAVAMFGAANTLTGPVRMLGGALGEVLRPRLARHQGPHGDHALADRALFVSVALVVTLVVVLAGAFVLAGDQLGALVFGDAFAGLGSILTVAAVYVGLASTVHLCVVAMQTRSAEGPAAATRWRVGAGVLALVLVGPLCALDGARGAFAAMILPEALFLVLAVRWLVATPRAEPVGSAVES